jgi:hypothetical protein
VFLASNFTFTVAPSVNVKAVVAGVIVAIFAVVPPGVGHVAYQLD